MSVGFLPSRRPGLADLLPFVLSGAFVALTAAGSTVAGSTVAGSTATEQTAAEPGPEDADRAKRLVDFRSTAIDSATDSAESPGRASIRAALERLDRPVFGDRIAVCPHDGTVLFTSLVDATAADKADFELFSWQSAAEENEPVRLTKAVGYDGDAAWSADCSTLAWRASRPRGRARTAYRTALEAGRASLEQSEIWLADRDGSNARRLTYLDSVSADPAFFPDGRRLVFSSDASGDRELWSIEIDGGGLERLTFERPPFEPGADRGPAVLVEAGEPRIAWRTERAGQSRRASARWNESASPGPAPASAASTDRLRASIRWLADDARQGRGLETEGLEQAARWLAEQFAALGLAPGGADGYFHSFEVPVGVSVVEPTSASIDGRPLSPPRFGDECEKASPCGDFVPTAFSASTEQPIEAEVVAAGYGISAPELNHDDYAELDPAGKIVVVRRFAPPGARFEDDRNQRRYGDLRYKAFAARERGAAALVVVDWPELASGESLPDEAPLPDLRVDAKGDAGIPVIVVRREVGRGLFEGEHRVRLAVGLDLRTVTARNVVAKIEAGAAASGAETSEDAETLEGDVLVGGHFDHLGFGGRGSLASDTDGEIDGEIHNGADDNASGTAALLEIGRALVAERQSLERTVWVVAFSAEESGLLGSSALVRNPPPGLEPERLLAMINLDMVGRLRNETVQVLGAASAEEWAELVPPSCLRHDLECKLGGDGYGPSDQTPFYAAGVPVLHWFTGTHAEYHRPSDDAPTINAAGVARIAEATTSLLLDLATYPDRLTYRSVEAPVSGGDMRSFGASLGTIPDYAGADRPGVPVSGARPGSAAAEAGIEKGDLIVAIGTQEVRNIYDFVYILRAAKPGESTTVTVLRGERELTFPITYDQGRRRP